MNDHDPSNDFRRRQKIPYDWQVQRQRRRRNVGRFLIGIIGMVAITAVIFIFRAN